MLYLPHPDCEAWEIKCAEKLDCREKKKKKKSLWSQACQDSSPRSLNLVSCVNTGKSLCHCVPYLINGNNQNIYVISFNL